MKRSKFTESQILAVLKEADAGASVKDLCRRHGISAATFYQWKSKYGGLQASDLKRMRELESENARLKQLYAETALENKALKELIHRKL
jgi:putative transposase